MGYVVRASAVALLIVASLWIPKLLLDSGSVYFPIAYPAIMVVLVCGFIALTRKL